MTQKCQSDLACNQGNINYVLNIVWSFTPLPQPPGSATTKQGLMGDKLRTLYCVLHFEGHTR